MGKHKIFTITVFSTPTPVAVLLTMISMFYIGIMVVNLSLSWMVSGYLRNSNYNGDVEIPIDLYGIITSYYHSCDSENDWVFVKNSDVPLTCNSGCVLLDNDNDIIILGHNDREDHTSGKIYKYSIESYKYIH